MKTNRTQINNNLTHNVFGPVPSRRLGRSIGINNIPPKICTYGCIYCQVGRTTHFTVHRQPFYEPNELLDLVREKVNYFEWAGESIDALTIVPDGEPTLDSQLGALIRGLKNFNIPVAVSPMRHCCGCLRCATIFWLLIGCRLKLMRFPKRCGEK